MKCKHCGEELPGHLRECISCGVDNGYPNVRAASTSTEKQKLDQRYQQAIVSTQARGCAEILKDFGQAVRESKAVWARPIGILHNLVSAETSTYVSFARQISAGVRQPRDNEFDRVRQQYEEALFPYYSESIVFSSLTLSDTGPKGYGDYSIFFRENMISHRASVFEENPHVFVEKHKILLNKPIPEGYRATWDDRHILAQAKLHSKIENTTRLGDFPQVLAIDNGGTSAGDFIEVHIYGTINLKAIERVVGKVPRLREDRILWKYVKGKLIAAKVKVDEL